MSKAIVLIGGGEHCKVIIESLLSSYQYQKIVIVDPVVKGEVLGIPIVGGDECLERLFADGYSEAFISKGSIGNSALREKMFLMAEKIGFRMPRIIDKTAIISSSANIDSGVYIAKGAIISADARIERGAIVNTGAIVEHDCYIKEFAHLATGSVLAGAVSVGKHTHIGANTTIREGISIGSNAIIGMASVVTYSIENNVIAYGSPCIVKGLK